MNNNPAIIAFRLVNPLPQPGYEGTLAILTVEHGPWIIGGLRLCMQRDGALFLRPPKMKVLDDRVVMRSGADRDALLEDASTMVRGFLSARLAALPLAPSPESEPTDT